MLKMLTIPKCLVTIEFGCIYVQSMNVRKFNNKTETKQRRI